MSFTFCLMLLAALALAVVLLAALAIYWHAEAKDWTQIAMTLGGGYGCRLFCA